MFHVSNNAFLEMREWKSLLITATSIIIFHNIIFCNKMISLVPEHWEKNNIRMIENNIRMIENLKNNSPIKPENGILNVKV